MNARARARAAIEEDASRRTAPMVGARGRGFKRSGSSRPPRFGERSVFEGVDLHVPTVRVDLVRDLGACSIMCWSRSMRYAFSKVRPSRKIRPAYCARASSKARQERAGAPRRGLEDTDELTGRLTPKRCGARARRRDPRRRRASSPRRSRGAAIGRRSGGATRCRRRA